MRRTSTAFRSVSEWRLEERTTPAASDDDMEERTTVLAIECNTKHLNRMAHDLYAKL